MSYPEVNKAPVFWRQLDRCDVCFKKTHIFRLRIMLRKWKIKSGENALSYSRYDDRGWDSSATDCGLISIGPFADKSRVRVNVDDTTEEICGSQTWEGPGVLRSIVPSDFSAATNVVVSGHVGLYQREPDRSLTVEMGFTDAAGSTLYVAHQQDLAGGSQRMWFSIQLSALPGGVDPSEAYIFFNMLDASATQKWWVDCVSIESDRIRPRTYIETCGAPLIIIPDEVQTGAAKVCPQCVENYTYDSDLIGRPYEEAEDPIQAVIEEPLQ